MVPANVWQRSAYTRAMRRSATSRRNSAGATRPLASKSARNSPAAARPRPQRLERGRAVGSQHRVAVEAAVGFSAWVATTALIGDLRGEAFPLRSPRF
jgi:hypothetical protein